MKTKKELIELTNMEWEKSEKGDEDKWLKGWKESMIEYEAEDNIYVVYVGRHDVYKAFFDADTLEFLGTKC